MNTQKILGKVKIYISFIKLTAELPLNLFYFFFFIKTPGKIPNTYFFRIFIIIAIFTLVIDDVNLLGFF